MIGVSLYFQDINYKYLKSVVSLGVTNIFTSVQVVEEDYSYIDDKLKNLMEFSEENNIKLIPDISTRVYDKLGIKNIKELKEMGFKVVRVDGGFDTIEEMIELTKLFHVYLNASDVKYEFLQQLIDNNCEMDKISVMHNFYPKCFSGLEKNHMININKNLKKYGVRIAAFVQGDKKLRGPVYEGLPTLEIHRGVNPLVATIELKKCLVDDIFIGDNEATEESLKLMKLFDTDGVIGVKSVLDNKYEHLYDKNMPIRRDITDSIIRLQFGRKGSGKEEIKDVYQKNTIKRYIGAITVDNILSGRYEGEINIVKSNLPSDGKVNVIGHIYPEFIDVLNFLDRDAIIKFVK